MSWLVSLASSNAAMRVCSCRAVHLSARKPSWLSCRIWYFSPYAESILVSVLVNNLYIVLASAIGLWLVRWWGFPFLYKSIVRLVFQDSGICFCL